MQVWNLQTRLGPGPGKIMSPVKVAQGSIPAILARRVSVSTLVDGKLTLAILGSKENDVITHVEVGSGVFEVRNEITLPGRNGTIPDAATDIWEDCAGQVFQGVDSCSSPLFTY